MANSIAADELRHQGSPTASPILELRGIEKDYGTEQNPVHVLKGIDFSVNRGEYVAIIGPSGSGKSTLLNILGCLDRPSKGEYFIEGQDVARLTDSELSLIRNQQIGFVFQSFHLVSHLSVMENVELPLFYARIPRRERRRRCRKLIDKVGLGHRTSHIPSELSGGEKQRTAVARSLTNDPAMLLADEPTGNLDSATSTDIMGLFAELNQMGRTIVLITHDLDIARSTPRGVALRDGEVESDSGVTDELVAKQRASLA